MVNENLQKKIVQSIHLMEGIQKRYPNFKKFLENKFGTDLTL